MIVLASDHAGYFLKEKLKVFLIKKGFDVKDVGAHSFKKNDDYPQYMAKAARLVQKDPSRVRAIIIGGSGQGEAISANRFKKVRAIVYYGGPAKIITLSREHNNSNVLSLGARFISDKDAKRVVTTWLSKKFSKVARHQKRINQIDRLG